MPASNRWWTVRLLSLRPLAQSRKRSVVRPEATPSEWEPRECVSRSHRGRLSLAATRSARAAIRWTAVCALQDATRTSPVRLSECSLLMCLQSTSTPARSNPEGGRATTKTLLPRFSPSGRSVPEGSRAKTLRASSAMPARALASVGGSTQPTRWRAQSQRLA